MATTEKFSAKIGKVGGGSILFSKLGEGDYVEANMLSFLSKGFQPFFNEEIMRLWMNVI